ncbi:hypothetical protein [Haloplanus sp.]|uniref:hypothetical protein n=1 Tax=Haloplanus sp. TaxID=1961696 RepID=UPI00262EE16B|nr:hypothetical protein [Haloplanus sp.]
MQADTATDTGGFRHDLLVGARVVDVAVLCAVPAVLVAVFTLPAEVRRSFAFAYTDPTLPTAFTAHYVHLRATHLAGNLVGYGLLAGVGYALAVLGDRRRFFLTALATFLLAFPFVLSALNLAVPRNAIGFGFSGINMALLGLLPLLLWGYARERFASDASVRPLPAAFFLLVGWIALLALPVSTTGVGIAGLATAAAGLAVGVVYALSAGVELRLPTRDLLRTVTSRPGYGDLFVAGGVLLVGYPIVGFPADPTGTGRVVNLYVHLLGFCLAFIGAFVLLAGDVVDE